MPSKDPLPSKENAVFKKILKCYEIKQYRQGLKLAKQILSNQRYSEHGETLAMKGLILNCVGRKEEAYEHVRKGLRNDLTSHVCWHVFGLLQRSDRKYDEAIKAYRNALRWDKDNLQIMRDLSLLQIQMRDYDGYRETRKRLLELRPGQRASWIGYAMSWHLLRDYEMALCVIDEFRKTLTPKPYDYEYSELVLYQCSIMEEAGRTQEALTFIEKHEKDVVDRLYYEETRARLYTQLGDRDNAQRIYRELLDRNAENILYYQGLDQSSTYESVDEKLELYKELIDKSPRASMPKKLPLSFTSGDKFKSFADDFLRRGLRKGVPSLFMNLKPLYSDASKVDILQELVNTYYETLKDRHLFHPDDTVESNGGELEPPTTLLWCQVYLSQHYEYLGDFSSALKYIDEALNDTPTLPELHMIRGKIYKHAGNLYESYKCLDEAQSLDTADRYINCKCAKLMLRNNMVKEAELLCQQFTREGVAASDNLNEMQCMWFQTECAAAYARKQEWGNALRQCHQVDKHFTEMTEDQFDFHTYCLRKMTLRSYVSLLRLEDVLRNHKFYFKAASTAIKIYLHLHNNPLGEESGNLENNPDNLTPSELRKLKNKQRKAQKKAAAAAAQEKAAVEEANKQKSANDKSHKTNEDSDNSSKVDELQPGRLERCEDPLEQAIKFLVPLQTLCADKIQSHVLAYEIYSRKNKPLLMLKAIKGGHKLSSNDPQFHVCLVKFLSYVLNTKELASPVKSVLDEEITNIYGALSPQQFNDSFLERNETSIPHRLAAARAVYFLDRSRQDEALKLACCLDSRICKGLTLVNCTEVLDCLMHGELGSCRDAIDSYKRDCHKIFPFAAKFSPATEHTNGPTTGTLKEPTGECDVEK